jgi:hypothetical protein
MTTIKINPTVKTALENKFGVNPLTDLMIATYEGVYNLAFQDGISLEKGHKIAMESLVELAKMVKKNDLSF